jgi:hypothetical protein
MSEANEAAAAAWLACELVNRVSIPNGAAGATPVNVGAIPRPTAVANVENAASNASAASWELKAPSSPAAKAVEAVATLVEAGRIAAA